MTLLAGIVARQPGAALPEAACRQLRDHLSRNSMDRVQSFSRKGALLLKVDMGAFGEPAAMEDQAGFVSLLAGEPLLAVGDPAARRARGTDLAWLHRDWTRGDWSTLTRARGIFAAVHYSTDSHQLTLVADKLGVRPLYYWIDDRYVVFASALRVLEKVALVSKTLDLRAVIESVSLNTPLGQRTPYLDIHVLGAAELIDVTPGAVTHRHYWHWDAIQPAPRPETDHLHHVWERFSNAVSSRLGADSSTVATLSGGLDSRCVVAALRARSVRVRTFGFGAHGTQDASIAAMLAGALGTDHENDPMKLDQDISFPALTASMWRRSHARKPLDAERPRLLWSGDGGSVGMGYVYQTRAMVDALRSGRTDDVIAMFIQQQGAYPGGRMFQPAVRDSLATMPADGIRAEMATISTADPGRRLHLFLVLNDQRRHLAGHFEDIDVNRLELLTPFYDSDLLEVMLEVPIDACLYHQFYAKWLELFPPVVTSIPWQTYPGHVPCPLPMPAGVVGQWDVMQLKELRKERRQGVLRKADQLLAAEDFPHPLLRKNVVRVAAWMHRVGAGEYGYVMKQAAGLWKYWRRSNHRWVTAPLHTRAEPPRPLVKTAAPAVTQ